MLVTALAAAAASTSPQSSNSYVPLISSITAIVAVVAGLLTTFMTLKRAKKAAEAAAWQKANELELESIKARLEKFYGPYRELSGIGLLFYRDLHLRQQDDKFLLIEKLFDRAWLSSLSAGEKVLVEELATNARRLREFIEEHAGMADDVILPYLSRVSAHYRMIERAYAGDLGDDPGPFVERYVFPSQVDAVLQLEVERLHRRRELLMRNPFAAPPPTELLVLPPELALKEWPNPPRTWRPELNQPV